MYKRQGVICVRKLAGGKPKLVYFMTIDKAKFRKPVVPGDTIEFHVRKTANRRNMWWYHAEAKVDGKVVAEADVGAMISDA